MAGSNGNNIVIIRRISSGHAKHHGGAWKVAYADFVTAMMAFFLLLWLIATANPAQLQGISEYFTPRVGGPDDDTHELSFKETLQISPEMSLAYDKGEQSDDTEYFVRLEASFRQLINNNENIIVENIPDGLSIQIIDREDPTNFLFRPNQAVLQESAAKLLAELSQTIKSVPRYISITGHTTSAETNTDPWLLSAERANAVRMFLLQSGLEQERAAYILAKADVEPLLPGNRDAVQNRRINIVLLKNSVLPYQVQNLPKQ